MEDQPISVRVVGGSWKPQNYTHKYLGEIPLPIQILLAFTATGTTTILWEFYEYFLDSFFGAHNVRGINDTIVDFITGLSGALVLSLLYRKRSS